MVKLSFFIIYLKDSKRKARTDIFRTFLKSFYIGFIQAYWKLRPK